MEGSDDDDTPHFSLAYVNRSVDPTGIRAGLDAVAVTPVTASVRGVTLIEMHRDNRRYEWRSIAQVGLGA